MNNDRMRNLLLFVAGVSACLAFMLGSGRIVDAACNAPGDANGCPLKVLAFGIEQVVFDRCFGSTSGQATQLGNSTCNMYGDVNRLKSVLGQGTDAEITQMKNDLDAFYRAIIRDSINQDSIRTFNEAVRYQNDIIAHVDNFRNDPKCGDKNFMNNLLAFFETQKRNILDVADLGAKAIRAGQAATPAVQEATTVLDEIGALANDLKQADASTRQKIETLRTEINKLKTAAEKMSKIVTQDLPTLAQDGVALASSTGVFVGNCTLCTGLLVKAASEVTVGTGVATGGTAACPESAEAFGGSCWALPGGLVINGIGAISAAVSSIPCTAVVSQMSELEKYVARVERTIDTVVKLSDGIRNSIDAINRASEALQRLAETVGPDARQHVQKMQDSLNRAGDALNRSHDIMAQEVVPATKKVVGGGLRQLAENTLTLVGCYDKVKSLGGNLSTTVINAMGELSQALTLLVDGGRVIRNFQNQSVNALSAGQTYIRDNWGAIDQRGRTIYRDAFGVDYPTVDIGRTATHLATTMTLVKTASIISNSAAVITSIGDLSVNASRSAKNAFLNLDNNKRESRLKFDQAGQKAQQALTAYKAAAGTPKLAPSAIPRLAGGQTSDVAQALGTQKCKKLLVSFPINNIKIPGKK